MAHLASQDSSIVLVDADVDAANLELVLSPRVQEEKPFFVCQVCGYTVEGAAPDKCPICQAPKERFKQVD